jgi:hypothetical protein
VVTISKQQDLFTTILCKYLSRGVLPSDQRRKLMEKAKARAKKDRISGVSEVVVGALVNFV